MKFQKFFGGTVATAALTLAAAGASMAWYVPVGTTSITSCSQTETLSSGNVFTLYTNVFYNSSNQYYTYQYDLLNGVVGQPGSGDAAGLTTFSTDMGYASDAGTNGMGLFFGDAPDANGIVGRDSVHGYAGTNGITNVIENNGHDNVLHTPSMEAYASNGQVVFQTLPGATPLHQGQSDASQFNDYFYVQSKSAPVKNDIYVADKNGAHAGFTDCAGTCPCGCQTPPAAVPEPGSVASLGLGILGILGLALRASKRYLNAK